MKFPVPIQQTGTSLKCAFLSSLMAVLSFSLPGLAMAQTCTALYDFTATPEFIPRTNSDGSIPQGGLLLAGNTLYGTASGGGASGNGTLFKVNIDGSGFATLHSFTDSSSGVNSDGYSPMDGLIVSANTLYGSANSGGTSGNGTLFKVNTDGSGFATLHNFTGTDGRYLAAGLVLSGNTLYGSAFSGGSAGNGTLFKVNTDGSGFIVLHQFSAADMFGFNSDGTGPQGSLVLSGDTLYGTASAAAAGFRARFSRLKPMAPASLRSTLSALSLRTRGPTLTELAREMGCSCPAIRCMGLRARVALWVMALSSNSKPMAQPSPHCITSPARPTTERVQMQHCSYPAAICMALRILAAVRAPAPLSN